MEDVFVASFRTSGLTSAGFRQLIRGSQRAFGNENVVLVEWSANRKLFGGAPSGAVVSVKTAKYARQMRMLQVVRQRCP